MWMTEPRMCKPVSGAKEAPGPEIVSGAADTGTEENAIPARYRNTRGGVNLEQVRRDQRRARRDALRALARRLRNLVW
jgi:hypothetical protein